MSNGRGIPHHPPWRQRHLMNHWRRGCPSLEACRLDIRRVLIFDGATSLAQLELIDQRSLERAWGRLFLEGRERRSILTGATAGTDGGRYRSRRLGTLVRTETGLRWGDGHGGRHHHDVILVVRRTWRWHGREGAIVHLTRSEIWIWWWGEVSGGRRGKLLLLLLW